MSVNDKMTAIADAVRAKTGGTAKLTLDDMATEIEKISVGVDEGALWRSVAERNMTNVVLPVGTTMIGYNCFAGCSSLSSIQIPDTVTEIMINAFRSCTSLTELNIPSGVTTISTQAFVYCSNITKITIDKPQDSIAGAPWGATNATIIWTGGTA